jgi:hypothetical protein
VDGVPKEICMIALVYTLVRRVMFEAARQQEVEVAVNIHAEKLS